MPLPYMPLYVADYLGDTTHLTLEQHGAYLKLLLIMWRAGGELPNDEAKIARMLGITVGRWQKMSAEVMGFFEHNEAYFWSVRLNAELKKTGENLAQKSLAGKAAAEAKRLKKLKTAKRPNNQSESEPELFKESPTPLSAAETARIIWAAAPKAAKKRSSGEQLTAALEAAAKRGRNLAVIRQAVAAYYADPDTCREDHRWAKGAHRVVQNDFWQTWAEEGVEHLPAPPDAAHQRRVWTTWMEDWKRDPHAWDRNRRGPTPAEPGCRITPEFMAEFGYTPPARAAR